MAQTDILLEAGTNELEIIEFFIDEGAERGLTAYGVNVAKVLEVIESPGLVPIPGAPHPCFMGTIPLRDIVLPVLDLAVWLGLSRVRRDHEIILVTRFNSRTTGFLATGVTNIHRFHWRDVEPPHRSITSLATNCVTGLVRQENRFILLLDLEKIIFELDAVQPDDAPPPSAIRLHALVAEDSGVMRHMIRERLDAANFEVSLAGNGQQALDRLLNQKDRQPDIVISDIEMPLLDGYTLTRRIRENPALAHLPVILFSSLITEELRHKGLSVGADEQISKPQFGDLARIAMTLIEKRRRPAV
ncbi:chemotaxis protein [Desulfovibrio sp. TomC]|uniref:chemotaxis protein n=1 Tax=Desulfovibrio sp. TomC TaxID=1562888 RepID=UPI0005757D58|nr:chemotaxis protein [Desulfovibrio sp. TomC]KHK00780.1 Chemotaxis protein CheV [Desulfovibrio sp. TomC]